MERGPHIGSNVLSWGHVKLFSPNSLNHSTTGLAVLQEMGVPPPAPEVFPTGAEFVSGYLSHLGRYLDHSDKCKVLLGTRVLSVGRDHLMKAQFCTKSKERETSKFRVLVVGDGGEDVIERFDVIIDATGTYGNHNWLGKGGIPAKGERNLEQHIFYNIPHVSIDKFFGGEEMKVSMVVGGGASAVTTLAMLQGVGRERGGVGVIWLTRRVGEPYSVIENDPLPQREALYKLGNNLAEGCQEKDFASFRYLGNSCVKEVRARTETGEMEVVVESGNTGEEEVVVVDNLIGHVGYRPDMSITQELQVHYCYATEGPMRLAAAMMASGGGGGDCLAQVAPGPDMLRSPEPGLFVMGMKSYGRGSAFLLKIGQEQVQQVMQILTM